MKTYQDLMKAGPKETKRARFCMDAISEFMASKEYKTARDGESYYGKHNITIEKYQKFLTTMSGAQVPDIFSSNYKIKTLFFRRLVTQQVQYVLGNGMTLSDDKNKEKLGADFDFKLQQAAKRAMAAGRAFGFWNYDHLEVFGYADTEDAPGFCPLYSEETGELEAGVRFWFRTVNDKTITRATLYEADGYTDYIKKEAEKEPELLTQKRAYKTVTTKTNNGLIEEVAGENYGRLPIVPLYANDTRESELCGIRESIDAYDLIKSGLANDIDDADGFYWILQNTGGMDDVDLARFVQRIRQTRAAVVDGDQGVQANAHTLDVPTEARTRMLDILRSDIYEDFQALDVKSLSAAQKTTQEIQAAYQSQDNKCDDFEYLIIDFVQNILELAGVDDNPTFTRNRIVNQAEQTDMIIKAAQFLTEEAIIKHLPFLTPEEADEIIQQREADGLAQFNGE